MTGAPIDYEKIEFCRAGKGPVSGGKVW